MSLEIDSKINPWIKNYNITKDKEELNNLLNLGYKISRSARFEDKTSKQVEQVLERQSQLFNNNLSIIDEKMNSFSEYQKMALENMDHKMQIMEHNSHSTIQTQNEKFIDMVENLTGKAKTSAIKGKIAENFLESTIRGLFPNYILEVTAQSGHEADMQLYSSTIPRILIESKNYTNVVPTKEITKFKADLDRVHSNYGIFFSFNSKITGKNVMEIERYGNKVIIYVSDIDFNTEIINLTLTTLLSIISLYDEKKYISSDTLTKTSSEILRIINQLNTLYTSLSKQKYTLLEEKKKISNSLDNIHTSYIENEVIMKNIIDNIQDQINIKIGEINNIPKKIQNNNIEDLLDDNNKDIANKILTKISLLDDCNIVKESPYNYKIYKSNPEKAVSDITIGKTKSKLNIIPINACFSISKSDLTSLDSYVILLQNL